MTSFYPIVTILSITLAIFGIITNLSVLYFTIRHQRLRQLSVGGIIMLTCINDVLFDTNLVVKILEITQWYFDETLTYRSCTVQLIGLFFTLPAGKAGLLVLSIDRVMAVLWPFQYRVRNNARFALLMALFVYLNSTYWTVHAVIVSNWATTLMNKTCVASVIFPARIITYLMIQSVSFDLLVYILNGIIVFKVLKLFKFSSSVEPVTALDMSGFSNDNVAERQRQKRQYAITKTVLWTVLIHIVLSTIPFSLTAVASIAAEQGLLADEHVNNIGTTATICAIIESILNSYIYVTKLPHFMNIVRQSKLSILF